ncbi:mucin-like glycoprotein [Trypanosoma conorhini]|uniref:Mucin-like glycoprotein n=1 Tax=Trypanosoma conorhini TaxID=83891 RepID=A0A3R7KRV0_9TRYP|nr:mucin-like glycoprotein [Trypanosoma conorhini]RNF00102.1 mucin-like glycoprotein [Trypanosoma conorhini]
MALKLRRRAVCALALLALLCAPSVCGTATNTEAAAADVNVSVEVPCAGDGQNVSWRFPGESGWTPCAAATEGSLGITSTEGILTESLCHWAREEASKTDCTTRCAPSSSGSTAAVCTMNYPLDPGSELHKRWQRAKKAPEASSSPEDRGAAGTRTGNAATDGGKAPGESSAAAGGRAGGSAASPTGAASASQGRSGTPNSRPSAGGSDGSTATTTTRSPSAGSHAKTNADSSNISTPFVGASLLLLTAALSYAVG